MPSRVPAMVVLALCLALTASAAEKIRLRSDLWMPYTGDPAGEKPGYAIEIARKIFIPQGIMIDYQIMPWGDALEAVRGGDIEGVVGASRIEAAGLVVPAESIGESRVGIFVLKKSTWKYEGFASLEKIRLGVQLDYKYWDAMDDYILKRKEPQVIRIGGDSPISTALAQLNSGEIDALPETSAVFTWAVKDEGYSDSDFKTAYLHEGQVVYIAFAPRGERGERYARLFDAGVKELRRSGELTKILTRYGQTDWQK